MRRGTRNYYEDELAYLRELGDAFSRANPRIAGLLSQQATDPDVERLLEGFAFLTGKLRQRLDEELPELSHGILSLLWPHYLRPLPAMSIVEFAPDPSGAAVRLPSGTAVASRPVDGTACQFRTCGDVTLVPATMTDVTLEERAGSAMLTLSVTGIRSKSVAEFAGQGLRLFLNGARDARFGPMLLHSLLADLTRLTASDGSRSVNLPPSLTQGGFSDAEAVLPWPENSAPGYRLLQEHLSFPERFLFVDLPPLPPEHGLNGPTLTLSFTLSRRVELPRQLGSEHIRLNCVPVVNLFTVQADPIRPDQNHVDYRVRPPSSGSPHARVHAIEQMRGFVQGRPGHVTFEPFESFRHALPSAKGHFYRARSRPSVIGRGAEVWVSFVDGMDGSLVPQVDIVTVEVTCSNGQAAELVPIGGIDQRAVGSLATGAFRNITPVLPEVPPPLGGDTLWRLVAGLSRSLQPLDDIEALRTLIAGYDLRAVEDEQAHRRLELLLGGLREIATEGFDTVVRGLPARGRQVVLTVDRSGFAGLEDVFLFGTVFDAFLGVYAGLNTAYRLVVREVQTNTQFRFPTRAGRIPTL
jgi:type VI secretion system protein ImpG